MYMTLDLLTTSATFLAIGAISGTLSGLLGIGGGLVVVPILLITFKSMGLTDNLMELVTSTSLAIMVFTSLSSVSSHSKKGAVNWQLAKMLGIGIVGGSFVGRFLAARVAGYYLSILFIILVTYIAYRMFKGHSKAKSEPKLLSLWGLGIGTVGSMLGLGGGILTVPLLIKYSYSSQAAVAVSAACTFMLASSASINSIVNGSMNGYWWGSIYLPAVLGIAVGSFSFAPIGAKLAHKLHSDTLRKLFACFLVVVIIQMLFNLC